LGVVSTVVHEAGFKSVSFGFVNSTIFHVYELADEGGHLRGGDAAVEAVGVAFSDDGGAIEALGELGFGDLLDGFAGDSRAHLR